MKHIKIFLLFNMIVVMSCTSFAQKQTFDVVSFALPQGYVSIMVAIMGLIIVNGIRTEI